MQGESGSSEGLVAKDISKTYGKRTVVGQMSLHLRSREVICLLGPNGAGKTTFFYSLIGLVAPDSGTITLDGQDITHLPMYRRARLGLGYLPQEPSIFRGMTVEDNIYAVLEIVVAEEADRQEQLNHLLNEFSIAHLRKNPAVALSGGERRRLEIARALATKPRFILLDEPFAGVDPIALNDIRQLIAHLRELGLGVLITDHNAHATLSMADRAIIVYDGVILAQGTPHDIARDERVGKYYLGEDFSL